jgi:hypothetical protein
MRSFSEMKTRTSSGDEPTVIATFDQSEPDAIDRRWRKGPATIPRNAAESFCNANANASIDFAWFGEMSSSQVSDGRKKIG